MPVRLDEAMDTLIRDAIAASGALRDEAPTLAPMTDLFPFVFYVICWVVGFLTGMLLGYLARRSHR